MVFDVDKLKEALDSWSIDPALPGDGLNHKQRMRIAAAVRLVVAAQPLWWCEEHEEPSTAPKECWVAGDGMYGGIACRMVEGRWMPTGEVDGV